MIMITRGNKEIGETKDGYIHAFMALFIASSTWIRPIKENPVRVEYVATKTRKHKKNITTLTGLEVSTDERKMKETIIHHQTPEKRQGPVRVKHTATKTAKHERMKKTQLLYLFLFIFCFHVKAQEAGQCKNDVMQSYQLLSKPSDANPGIHMKYTIQNAYWDPIPEQKQEIIYLSNLKLHKTLVRTNDYTIYTDKSTAVTISHQNKTIMITANPGHGEENGPANHFLKMRDSIIMKSRVEECKSIVSNGQTYRQIKLLTHDSWKQNTHIHHLMFWIGQAKHIKKISIHYTKAHQWKHITLTMEKTDYSYKGNVFTGSAVQQIYTGQNTIRPEYKDYKVMNLIRE